MALFSPFLRTSLAVLLLMLGAPRVGFGQTNAADGSASDTSWTITSEVVIPDTVPPRVTLTEWARGRRIRMMDRVHGFGDEFYDRGVFRHITPGMDREFALDMQTYAYTPYQDYIWTQVDNGMRMRFGSTERSEFSMVTDIKQNVDLADNHTLRIDGRLEESPAALRSLIEMTYGWELASAHTLGIRHTFANQKTDLDASFYYQYGTPKTVRVMAQMTVLDTYHDFVNNVLGVSLPNDEFKKSYSRNPYLGQLTIQTPTTYALRGEIFVGVQPESERTIASLTDEAVRFQDEEAAHYLGAMVEYNTGPVTGGLMYQRDASQLQRTGLTDTFSSDYRTRQRFHRGGAFLLGSWGPFQGEAWFFLEEYYDRQSGSDFTGSTVNRDPDWKEYRKNYRVRLFYRPSSTGWFLGTEYLGMSRNLGGEKRDVLAKQWTRRWYFLVPSNYRINGQIGYRFAKGAVLFGINYDLDGDEHFNDGGKGPRRFDNGFFKFVIGW